MRFSLWTSVFVAFLISYCLVVTLGSPTASTNKDDKDDEDANSLGVVKPRDAKNGQRASKVDSKDKSKHDPKKKSKDQSKNKPKDRSDKSKDKSKAKFDERFRGYYKNSSAKRDNPSIKDVDSIRKEVKMMLDRFDLQSMEIFLDEMHKWVQGKLNQGSNLPVIPPFAA